MASDTGMKLADHCEHFIDQQVKEGRFTSPSDVIEAALLLLEEREAKRAHWLAVFEQAERGHEPRT